ANPITNPPQIVSQYTWSSSPPPGGIGPQQTDVSYGIIDRTTLLGPRAVARTLVPLSDPIGSAWTQVGFDDSTWISGTTGVGFKTDGTFNAVIGTDIQTPMTNRGVALVRVPFTVAAPASLTGLDLAMQFNDGFVAYLNGVEVARRNAPTVLNTS